MDPKEIVHHPVYPQQPPQSRGGFGIRVGLAAKGGTFAPQGTKERFGMIGMDIRLGNGPSGLRMFLPRTLVFGALATFFMRLCTFILHPDVHPSFESLLGASWFAIFDQFMTDLKEQRAITALTIRKETQVMGLSCNTGQRLDRSFKEFSILLATI